MTKLSVCIPVEPGMASPNFVVNRLLADEASSIEVIVRGFDDDVAASLESIAQADARLRILPPAGPNVSAARLWIDMAKAANGEWLSIIGPDDMIEPDLPVLLADIEVKHPGADALGWNAFQIDPSTKPERTTAVAVPMLHHITDMDKTQLLQSFFQWTGARQAPLMPFGLFHGAIKRSLFETILSTDGPMSWLSIVPQYEWSAKVLVFASGLAFSNRPLSAQSIQAFRTQNIPSALQGFPFTPRLGLTAAIAEVQARVLYELGSEWTGCNEHFVRACMFDCAMEHDRQLFSIKCKAYSEAIRMMRGGEQLVAGFQPQYMEALPLDARRGKFDHTLLVDRFIGKARTAQQFYMVMRSILAPMAIITEHPELLSADNANKMVSVA